MRCVCIFLVCILDQVFLQLQSIKARKVASYAACDGFQINVLVSQSFTSHISSLLAESDKITCYLSSVVVFLDYKCNHG